MTFINFFLYLVTGGGAHGVGGGGGRGPQLPLAVGVGAVAAELAVGLGLVGARAFLVTLTRAPASVGCLGKRGRIGRGGMPLPIPLPSLESTPSS